MGQWTFGWTSLADLAVHWHLQLSFFDPSQLLVLYSDVNYYFISGFSDSCLIFVILHRRVLDSFSSCETFVQYHNIWPFLWFPFSECLPSCIVLGCAWFISHCLSSHVTISWIALEYSSCILERFAVCPLFLGMHHILHCMSDHTVCVTFASCYLFAGMVKNCMKCMKGSLIYVVC
jgi:fumarate reductase subunit D